MVWTIQTATKSETKRAECLDWLDTEEGLVLYVTFGSQAHPEEAQMRKIGKGLEGLEVSFLWVVRGDPVLDDEFEVHVKVRGLVARFHKSECSAIVMLVGPYLDKH
ncbi:hypothetical protein AMTR_s00080p00130330 [Amborella trichopoda]|uniref:Uncharacterized protein n=1 Tax=Amborella trichopoda TaxID=13333 RepID=W1PBF1_AMBTC|nr:hypothetical protein AMTR_s00080p00130330 [Amborella trichopoda]